MARSINRLPASYRKMKPGLHADGGNLYLQVSLGPERNRRLSWIFRYQLRGHNPRDMGLGSVNDITLPDAREIARQNRLLVKQGLNPIERRNSEIAKNLAAQAAVMTFDEAAEAYIRQHRSGWKNPAHAAQWPATLKTYASPIIGRMSVADVETSQVMKIIEPIWHHKTETAKRLRGRIEAVLGWATVSGYRRGENPARWHNHLDKLLAAPGKVRPVKHQAALPYDQMPVFLQQLSERSGMAALALEFLILTCVRTSDVRNAKLDQIDVAKRIWVIPQFSKTGKEHKVPLSTAAVAVFQKARQMANDIGGAVARSEFAFPNDVTGRHLSENGILAVLNRMGRKGQMTAHGCRSSFRTWAQERTNFPWELAELSLGHTVGTKVERAYARGDAFKKRITIMQSWADFCGTLQRSGNVVPMQRTGA